jgi:hypothetical protein
MNKPFIPNEPYMLMRWSDLENAWRMLASPDKQLHVEETLLAIRALSQNARADKAVFTMIAATAWLTDDSQSPMDDWGQASQDDWQA